MDHVGYDIELEGLGDDARAEGVAHALGVSVVELGRLQLPAIVKSGVPDAEAEMLFHALHEHGAQVKLHRAQGAVTSSSPVRADAALPLPEFEAPEPPRNPTAPSPSAPSSPPSSSQSDAPEAGDLLSWQNTKIFWVYAGVAFAALGVWMIADPDFVFESNLAYRRVRFWRRVLGMIWSRPGGVGFIVLGLATGVGGWLRVRDNER